MLITDLGPAGPASGALCRKLGASRIIGIDVVEERMKFAKELGLCDNVLASGPNNVATVKELTGGHGVERAGLREGLSARSSGLRHPGHFPVERIFAAC